MGLRFRRAVGRRVCCVGSCGVVEGVKRGSATSPSSQRVPRVPGPAPQAHVRQQRPRRARPHCADDRRAEGRDLRWAKHGFAFFANARRAQRARQKGGVQRAPRPPRRALSGAPSASTRSASARAHRALHDRHPFCDPRRSFGADARAALPGGAAPRPSLLAKGPLGPDFFEWTPAAGTPPPHIPTPHIFPRAECMHRMRMLSAGVVWLAHCALTRARGHVHCVCSVLQVSQSDTLIPL
jgi:hypothetical protein